MTVQTKAPESQFAYVVLAARRARQIMAGAPPLIENPRTQKATRVAVAVVLLALGAGIPSTKTRTATSERSSG